MGSPYRPTPIASLPHSDRPTTNLRGSEPPEPPLAAPTGLWSRAMNRLQATLHPERPERIRNPYFGSDEPIENEAVPSSGPAAAPNLTIVRQPR